ncbi:MAG: hypothetical protein ABSE73_20320, partial [Planctomycetota bacterium]
AEAAAALPLICCSYDLVTEYPPLQGFLQRIPTNLEYLLSVLLAGLYLRFLKSRSLRAGILLAGLSVALVYLRPLMVIPWSLALISGAGFLVLTRQLRPKVWLAMAAVLAVGVLPWLLIERWNSNSEAYRQTMGRLFQPLAYIVHRDFPLLIGAGLVLAAATRWVVPWARPFAGGTALATLALPFISGLFPFSYELLFYDRFGAFYLVALAAAAMLTLAHVAQSWSGRHGTLKAGRAALVLALAAILAAVALARENLRFDITRYPRGPYAELSADARLVPAYDWVREHTPPDALFVVDGTGIDLFQIVARRRRVYHPRLYGSMMSSKEFDELYALHDGVLSGRRDKAYLQSLAEHPLFYVLWRKTAPLPRGPYGARLQKMSTVVYSDKACEIWQVMPSREEER